MNESEILKEFTDTGAILKGHFILTSGLHSDTYLQCARVLMNPTRAEKVCKALADKVRQTLSGITFDLVVSPAMGGIIVGYEMGRQMGLSAVFCERESSVFTFRRGFTFDKGAKILVVEDVVTTAKSSLETIECIKARGGRPIAEASLVDRRGKAAQDMTLPLISLLKLDVPTYKADELPDHLKHIPAVKPGSRFLKTG